MDCGEEGVVRMCGVWPAVIIAGADCCAAVEGGMRSDPSALSEIRALWIVVLPLNTC